MVRLLFLWGDGFVCRDCPPRRLSLQCATKRATTQGTLQSLARRSQRYSTKIWGDSRTDIGSVRRTIRAIEIAAYYARYPEQDPWKKLNATIKTQGNEPQHSPLILCIQLPREERVRRIGERLKKRLEEGLIEEVEQLIASGVPTERLIQYGLEYRFITQHLLGELSREEMIARLEIAIRQFAKRQMTWFRGMERRGYTLHYLDGTQSTDRLCQEALEYIASKREGKLN